MGKIMLSRIRRVFSSKYSFREPIIIDECPIHGKTIFLEHMVNYRCVLCDGYSKSEIESIIKKMKNKMLADSTT